MNFRGICIVVNEKADFDLSYVIKWKNVICVIFVRTNGRRYVIRRYKYEMLQNRVVR